MPPEMVKAVCEKAHEMGYTVAAHVESPEGVRVALENGVDSIEHGAKPDADILRLFRERGAFLCTTISPALPYACLLYTSLDLEVVGTHMVHGGQNAMEDVVAAMELSGPLHGDDIPWIRHHAQQTFVPLGVGTDGAGAAGGEVAADGTEGHLLLGLHLSLIHILNRAPRSCALNRP